jgi:hypothetical protein
MYKNDIFIAVREDMEEGVESIVKLFGKYRKEISDSGVFFSLKDVEYDDTEFHAPSEALMGSLSKCNPSEYAVVRFGDDVEDTEIHGRIQDFGIKVIREIRY